MLWRAIVGVLVEVLYFISIFWLAGMLRRELEGYQAYAARVRYRLLPGVW